MNTSPPNILILVYMRYHNEPFKLCNTHNMLNRDLKFLQSSHDISGSVKPIGL